jgi:hypothetical protein
MKWKNNRKQYIVFFLSFLKRSFDTSLNSFKLVDEQSITQIYQFELELQLIHRKIEAFASILEILWVFF